MKLATTLIAAAFTLTSAIASANISVVKGKVESINTEAQTISIISNNKVETYKYDTTAKSEKSYTSASKVASLRKGDKVVLKLESAK